MRLYITMARRSSKRMSQKKCKRLSRKSVRARLSARGLKSTRNGKPISKAKACKKLRKSVRKSRRSRKGSKKRRSRKSRKGSKRRSRRSRKSPKKRRSRRSRRSRRASGAARPAARRSRGIFGRLSPRARKALGGVAGTAAVAGAGGVALRRLGKEAGIKQMMAERGLSREQAKGVIEAQTRLGTFKPLKVGTEIARASAGQKAAQGRGFLGGLFSRGSGSGKK